MTRSSDDIDVRTGRERDRLVGVLEGLDETQWAVPSACAGWSVRDLVVHLLMPYELGPVGFARMLVGGRGSFDRGADRWARADRRTPAEVLAGLRATAGLRFGFPPVPPLAGLSHLVIHAEDVYRPLGVPSPADPDDARVVLAELTGPRGRRSLPTGLGDGLSFAATDTDWRLGTGPEVRGPATALLPTLVGRTSALSDLDGAGVAELRSRLSDR